MDFGESHRKKRVAILLVGLTRKFREASKTVFEHLIHPYRDQIDVDFYCYTWNISGDYTYENKDFTMPVEKNWIKDDNPIDEEDLNQVQETYQPKILQMEDYRTWKATVMPRFEEFMEKFKCSEEPLRLFNGVFAQYYQVYRGFQAMEKYLTEEHPEMGRDYYDLIIRTRYDWKVDTVRQLDWNELINLGKSQLISLEQWDRFGVRGNWIAGSMELMKKYSELYLYLDQFTEEDVRQSKLPSIVVPRYVFNYYFEDHEEDPENMDEDAIFSRVWPYFRQQMMSFISRPTRLTFRVSLIPEIMLKHYLNKIRGINTTINTDLIDGRVVEGQKSHKI